MEGDDRARLDEAAKELERERKRGRRKVIMFFRKLIIDEW